MNSTNDISTLSSSTAFQHRHNVNWHEAAACAIEIELPRNLIKHLTDKRHLTVENSSKGIYHISIETFDVDDYAQHQGQDIYTKYLNQLATAITTTKGESAMVCEGFLNLFGTSSAEIIANAKKESEAQINELTEANRQLSESNGQLSSQIDRLKELLRPNNISFE